MNATYAGFKMNINITLNIVTDKNPKIVIKEQKYNIDDIKLIRESARQAILLNKNGSMRYA